MDNMSLDLGQCLIPKVIGISIRAYKFLWRIDRCSMRFISRLISHGSNFLFDDFFFFSDEIHLYRCSKMFYVSTLCY